MKAHFLTGSYAEKTEPGVHLIRYDPETGFRILEAYDGFLNPSFVAVHPRRQIVYLVEETGPEGAVCAARREDGKLRVMQTLKSGGADPCHLSLSKDLRSLYAANYSSGSLAVFLLDGQGEILERSCIRQHAGMGADPVRQEGPHVHFSMEREGELLVCDLGLDTVAEYRNTEGQLAEAGRIAFPPASGPRHLAASGAYPDLVFCTAELDNRVYVLQKQADGSFRILQEISALPADFTGKSYAAAIHFSGDGRLLMVSNRGHDSIAVFRTEEDGRLADPVISPCVAQPRDFLILGDDVIVGSQRDSVIRAYRLNRETLRLEDTGRELAIPKPVCLAACDWA